MKLIYRAAIISVFFLLILSVIFFLLMNLVIIPNVLSIEDQESRSAGETVRNIIYDDGKNIQRSAFSYGMWDETFLYVTGNNPDYFKNNLKASSLLPEGLHGALLFSPNRTFLSGVSYNDTTGADREIPQSVLDEIIRDDLLFSRTLAKKGVSGFVSTPDASFLIGTGAILPSNNSGQAQGVLIFFKDIDPGLIRKYEDISGYNIRIAPFTGPGEPLSTEHLVRINESVIRYEAPLSSPAATLPLIISIDQARIFYNQQTDNNSTLFVFLLLAGGGLAVFLFLTISGSIIRPLTRFDQNIREITRSGDLSHKTDIKGASEITSLASSFNSMLGTIREKEEQISRMAEERYRNLMERASDAILVADPDSYQVIDANIKAEELFSSPDRTLIGSDLRELHAPQERDRLNIFRNGGRSLGEGGTEEGVIQTGQGPVPVELSASMVEIHESRYLLCFYRDITERKRMLAALTESEEMFRQIAAGTIVGIFLVQNGRFVYLNDRLAEMCGYPREEMMNLDGYAGIITGIEGFSDPACNQVPHANQGELCTDSTVMTKDGSARIFRIYASSIEYKGKTAIIGTTVDITWESELLKQRKIAFDKIEQIMEQLAAYNDHIRNPLTIIFGMAELDGGARMQEIQRQVLVIDNIIDQVDQGFLESTKIRDYMKKHYFDEK